MGYGKGGWGYDRWGLGREGRLMTSGVWGERVGFIYLVKQELRYLVKMIMGG